MGNLGVAPNELLMSRLLRTKLLTADINLRPRIQDIRDRQSRIQEGYKACYGMINEQTEKKLN